MGALISFVNLSSTVTHRLTLVLLCDRYCCLSSSVLAFQKTDGGFAPLMIQPPPQHRLLLNVRLFRFSEAPFVTLVAERHEDRKRIREVKWRSSLDRPIGVRLWSPDVHSAFAVDLQCIKSVSKQPADKFFH